MGKVLKKSVDAFFTVTESKAFKRWYFKSVGKIMKAYGFKKRHVKASYKLLTRKFWTLQIWFWKWIVTGGFVKSAKSSGGSKDFKKGSKACKDFVGTVDLGGKVMTKFKSFPQVVAAGGVVITAAKVAKPIC